MRSSTVSAMHEFHYDCNDCASFGITPNRPFPNYLKPLLQSESWCPSFHMKMRFHSHVNVNSFSYEKMGTKTRYEEEA